MITNYKERLGGILLLLLFSCDAVDNEPYMANCASLVIGVIEKETAILESEINNLSEDLEPKQTGSDQLGHAQNLQILVDRLNDQCADLNVEVRCYACILTLPVQSEILLQTDSSGTVVTRVIDILTPENKNMTFFGVHNL